MAVSTITRRKFLANTALVTTAAVAAPYVRRAHAAAGKLSLGIWDHWVPGANDNMTKLCQEWGERNKVEIQIDYLTSVGEKDVITATAEAQAGAGHDIMTHRSWQVAVHRHVLEPVDDVMAALEKEAGPVTEIANYLARHDGHWYGIPTSTGSQVKPCCSRLDLYKQHAGIDLQKIFPASGERDKSLTDSWNWDAYLSSAEKLMKAGTPVGNPLGQTPDAIDWIGALFRSYGVVAIDEKDNIKINSDATRQALDYMKKLAPQMPAEVYAWDDAGNNRWLVSGKGAGILNPPSAWAVARRDAPKVAENCWTHDIPRGPAGRFVGNLPIFFGVWQFSKNKEAAKQLILFLSKKDQARKFVEASFGYDLPSFKTYYDFDTWKTVGPPVGTVYNYPPRDDEQVSIAGYPARPDVAAQVYNSAMMVTMVSKVTQGGESIDGAIKWAENELEGYLRT
ncbi:MAG TPA: extracellular solute-binding protein [Stellaceae bacterium]|jgi:ABC-type glycerol-3-phosphate transport system substrate-binding protein